MKYIYKLTFAFLMFIILSTSVSAKTESIVVSNIYNEKIVEKYKYLGDPNDPGCQGLLGGEMTKVVNNIFKTVQYAAPILVIALTIVDYAKAALSGASEDMKKAHQKLGKRVISAILLFFVPLLCSLIFSIAGVTVPETCIGK